MQNLTREVKAAIRHKIDRENRGGGIEHGLRIPEWHFALDRAKVAVRTTRDAYKIVRYENWRDATDDCEILATIPRRYSQKKRNGFYAELVPAVPTIAV